MAIDNCIQTAVIHSSVLKLNQHFLNHVTQLHPFLYALLPKFI